MFSLTTTAIWLGILLIKDSKSRWFHQATNLLNKMSKKVFNSKYKVYNKAKVKFWHKYFKL